MEKRFYDMVEDKKGAMYPQLISFLIMVMTLCFYTSQASAQGSNLYKVQKSDSEANIHETKYDFSDFAQKITAGANGNYQKIKAIYQWICENIDYDTSYSIHDADQCVEKQRGVCQAYCELFYYLAKAVGVQVEIISGKSKDDDGNIGRMGHAWLFAYTKQNQGILLDPTWGAGYVENGQFHRRKNCWIWFDVSPEWMILSHYPDEQSDQLLSIPVSWKDFLSMPAVNDSWLEYGVDSKELSRMARKRNLTLPRVYSGGEGEIELIDFPRSKTLRIGQFYKFRIKMMSRRDFSVWNKNISCKKNEWKNEGNNIYSTSFMPRETGELSLSLKADGSNYWNNVVKYDIEQPTKADWKKVEEHYPLSLPEMKNVKNLDEEKWNSVGINGHQLLMHIREGNVKELPIIYDGKGQRFTIISFPMNKYLKAGQSYTFSFRPLAGMRWALVNNKQWHKDWQTMSDGTLSMTIIPTTGSLLLYTQLKDGENYWSCIEYEVR